MGTTTNFNGGLSLSRPLNEVERYYINTFSSTRRMKRDSNKLMELYKGKHGLPNPELIGTPKLPAPEGTVTLIQKPETLPAVNPYGVEGEFFCKDDGFMGQTTDNSILDGNYPASTQPGLWCQWIINGDNELVWNEGEKFYNYIEWLKYMIKNFFEPWGVKLNGEIEWRGEDWDDTGTIVVNDNIVTIE